jgi:hypothetical protein
MTALLATSLLVGVIATAVFLAIIELDRLDTLEQDRDRL